MEPGIAFLLGFAGSLHCAGMCGPLVLALTRASPANSACAAGKVIYQVGRVISYCLIGLMLGLLGSLAKTTGFQRGLSIALGVSLLAGWFFRAKIPLTTPMWKGTAYLKNTFGGLLRQNTLLSQAVLGSINGLLPCGLVYVAAAGAVASGHPLNSVVWMACFGLGTWPMMLGIHLGGHRIPLPSRFSAGVITRTAVLVMATLLILRGLDLGIPFVSPNLSMAAGGDGRCH